MSKLSTEELHEAMKVNFESNFCEASKTVQTD